MSVNEVPSSNCNGLSIEASALQGLSTAQQQRALVRTA